MLVRMVLQKRTAQTSSCRRKKSFAIKAETDEEIQTQSRLMRLSLSFTDEQLTLLNQLALATPEQYGVIARSTNYAASHKRARF